ncbi:hypothetical protein ACHAXA_011000 [Cyclostephanos tholiformis]|uniref:Uncharacterized protein n=1 Tax=Cyclostephanos tholiformis TaxID=382380 RepID=A0ABD3RAS1_9STRA
MEEGPSSCRSATCSAVSASETRFRAWACLPSAEPCDTTKNKTTARAASRYEDADERPERSPPHPEHALAAVEA